MATLDPLLSPPRAVATGSFTRTASNTALSLAVIGWGAFLYDSEPDWYYLVPTAVSFLLAMALCFLLSRRPRWSFFAAAALFLGIFLLSWAKYSHLAMKFHVYDIAFHVLSWTQLGFFVVTFPTLAATGTLVFAAAVVVLVLLWRWERPVDARLVTRVGLLGLAGGAAFTSAYALFDRNADFFESRRHFLSSFIYSFGDLPHLTRFGGLIETTGRTQGAPVSSAMTCAPTGPRPDIVLFLNESAMPPGVYPDIVYPEETKPMFASFDGKVRRLRVETFGGGTWLSDFSALTGLSTWSFGSMRNFAAQYLTGRLKHSLPLYLKACGYDTTIIYPSTADFAASDRFYRAIGFDRIVDRTVHGAPDERQRDAFYYGQVLNVLAGAAPGRPQLIVASSMATHGPWDFRFGLQLMRPGDAPSLNGDKELDEYLWRLVLAERDRKAFHETIAARLPDRPVLVVSYGDHQPALTRIPLRDSLMGAASKRRQGLAPTSTAFETYWAIHAHNFAPRLVDPEPAILEIPYLSTMLIKAAGLPLDPVFRRRDALMRSCGGLYQNCGDREQVLGFHRWFADAGWISFE